VTWCDGAGAGQPVPRLVDGPRNLRTSTRCVRASATSLLPPAAWSPQFGVPRSRWSRRWSATTGPRVRPSGFRPCRAVAGPHGTGCTRGVFPTVLRCDNGPELACSAMADWAHGRSVCTSSRPGAKSGRCITALLTPPRRQPVRLSASANRICGNRIRGVSHPQPFSIRPRRHLDTSPLIHQMNHLAAQQATSNVAMLLGFRDPWLLRAFGRYM